jgi:hypothetical protein
LMWSRLLQDCQVDTPLRAEKGMKIELTPSMIIGCQPV